MSDDAIRIPQVSRRSFLQGCAVVAGTSLPAFGKALNGYQSIQDRGMRQRVVPLDSGWLLQEKANTTSSEAGSSPVTLPHTVTPLSWQNWDPSSWESVWTYRRNLVIPTDLKGLRLFLHFDRVMAGTTPTLNGHALPQHLGGFLPFDYEITDLVREGENDLEVAVDARWLNVPPAGSPAGPNSIDYMLPGGINGSVSLRAVPFIYLRDVFAKPVDVLQPDRRLEITCRIDAATPLPANVRLVAVLKQDGRDIAHVSKSVKLDKADQEVGLTLADLKDIKLWDVTNPNLYDLVVTLFHDDKPMHDYSIRSGFREARFEVDGFFLNGRRLRLFGLNRHELYPYVGFAAPNRLLRRDAEILRNTFNCNAVRCSHYPQSEAFLDACDELGLLVWEELPGWQYIGDESWQRLAVRDVESMIRRDRNHPSIIVWGVRINESHNDPDLYSRTNALARSLDDSRANSGTMTAMSTTNWHEDVFAFDDYHATPDHNVGIVAPLPGLPFMISEGVGQFNYADGTRFNAKYKRSGDLDQQVAQGLRHAQGHDRAAAHPRCAGMIAWCAFDYASLINSYSGIKTPGVADVFRIPKLGASFYMAQVDPKVRPVIEPDFYWDFGPQTPNGPGAHAAIFSNCDRLEIRINGNLHAVLHPDCAGFPNTKYPPFFVDLNLDGTGHPELQINGFVGDEMVLMRSFSSDPTQDRLWLRVDDTELHGDGIDATRLAFGAVDKFGVTRPFAEGEVSLTIHGPAEIVGDNPFQLRDNGGLGAVWIRGLAHSAGQVRIDATHASLGENSVELQVLRKG